MRFERFEDDGGLSHYSYVVACETSGEAVVVDPRRDVDVYLDWAEDAGVDLAHVVETHVHADYASGAPELAERAGATLWESAYDDGEEFEVAFAHEPLEHGASIEIGRVRLEALHTPGHTPEHVSFLVYDGARSTTVPEILLSGDFLFVGSLGRPDLLGEGAKEALARSLHHSVRERLSGLPDGLEVRPAHGSGSMCGAGMSGRPVSTLGFERIANPYLDPDLSEDAFVERILSNVPPFPDYYRRMKGLNAAGPPSLNGMPGLDPVPASRFRELAATGHVVVDLRDFLAWGGAHVPNSYGIGIDGSLSTWAAWVVPYDTPILLVADRPEDVEPAVRALVRVGLDDVRGWLKGGIEAWREAGYALGSVPQMDVGDLKERLEAGDAPVVLDVRSDDEWESGHIEGAVHVHGGLLAGRLDEVPEDGRGVAIVCGSGYRSTVAASVLERAGFDDLRNVAGGMDAWDRNGFPTVRG